jgi:hypothetical protein
MHCIAHKARMMPVGVLIVPPIVRAAAAVRPRAHGASGQHCLGAPRGDRGASQGMPDTPAGPLIFGKWAGID